MNPRDALDALLRPLVSLIELVRGHRYRPGDMPVGAIANTLHAYAASNPTIALADIGEFAATVSSLALLKSHELTPWLRQPEPSRDEAEMATDRIDGTLQAFEPATQELTRRFLAGSEVFAQADFVEPCARTIEIVPLKSDLLTEAIRRQLADLGSRGVTHVPRPIFLRVEMATRALQRSLRHLRSVSFRSIVANGGLDRRATVVYFLAVLELARKQTIHIRQTCPFDDLVLVPWHDGATQEQRTMELEAG